MTFWDFDAKNKIKSFTYAEQTPICCAALNPSGELFAYMLGNDWHLGVEGVGKWKNKLCVHIISET